MTKISLLSERNTVHPAQWVAKMLKEAGGMIRNMQQREFISIRKLNPAHSPNS